MSRNYSPDGYDGVSKANLHFDKQTCFDREIFKK